MQYIGEIAQIQQAASRTPDYAARRAATFEGLAPRAADRERQILDGWRKHAPFPNLPAVLRPRLVAAGFAVVRQSPVSILNTTYDTDTYSYWLARLVAAFVVERQLVAAETAAAWLDDLTDAVERDEYMFCSMAVVTCAVAS